MSYDILMSPSNPNGWKLESLCEKLRKEISWKCVKIAMDKTPVALRVMDNNRKIMLLLHEIENLQRASLKALDTIRPNEGPLGKPRIGLGSK